MRVKPCLIALSLVAIAILAGCRKGDSPVGRITFPEYIQVPAAVGIAQ